MAAENGSMEKLGTRKKTRDRFLVSGLFIENSHAPRMSHLSRGKASTGFPNCDIRMDGCDREEINVCDTPIAVVETGNLFKKSHYFGWKRQICRVFLSVIGEALWSGNFMEVTVFSLRRPVVFVICRKQAIFVMVFVVPPCRGLIPAKRAFRHHGKMPFHAWSMSVEQGGSSPALAGAVSFIASACPC
ncbi:MAG TPA: hypothetical protein VL202_14890 [Pararhizobium sp.]|uniref:hypothetical protein n=1 Tax=Pararhizobium sp. TaxID=1977563 RepID=UPI002BD19795|nr:hypothetical protein [Pararhizobium sp.]HTO32441.1 hypothetical protein [Pararhizobium sp.]